MSQETVKCEMKTAFDFLFTLLHAQFIIGAESFISPNESIVTSISNSTSPFNKLETMGDEITTTGPGLRVTEKLFPDRPRIGSNLCFHICANRGMGPVFAIRLG